MLDESSHRSRAAQTLSLTEWNNPKDRFCGVTVLSQVFFFLVIEYLKSDKMKMEAVTVLSLNVVLDKSECVGLTVNVALNVL